MLFWPPYLAQSKHQLRLTTRRPSNTGEEVGSAKRPLKVSQSLTLFEGHLVHQNKLPTSVLYGKKDCSEIRLAVLGHTEKRASESESKI